MRNAGKRKSRPEGRLLIWWSQAESNRRPLECHSSALPTELWPLGIDPQPGTGRRTNPKSGFLFVFAAFADDVGDVVVAFFLLFDEGGFLGLLDLEIVVALDGFAVLLAGGFSVGVLKRDKLDVGGLRQFGFGLLRLRGGGSGRCSGNASGSRGGCFGGAATRHGNNDLEHRAALWADDRIFAEIVEFGAATAAETLSAELGFCHGSEILKNVPDDEEKWCFPWPLARLLSIASAEPPWYANPMNQAVPASPLTARRSAALTGRVRVPGDKSISHRALILGALTVGETRITGLLEGEDVINTGKAMRALGATVERTGEGAWTVHGVGVAGFAAPAAALDFGNSGTGCRLVMGAVAGCPIEAVFDGDASLRTRPMRRILDPLEKMGARTTHGAEGGRLPVTVIGARDPMPIEYEAPVPSAQLKSAVLLAGLAAPGATTVIEKEATRDHTEKLLKHFGAHVRVTSFGDHGRRITLQGQPELEAAPVVVPADPSSAAFPLVAALIAPGSDIILDGVMMNPLRTGLLTTLREMGAAFEILAQRNEGGEDVADLRVKAGPLKGVDVPPERAPSMIDKYPILAVAAAFAEGTTRMRGLKELRVKESDRLEATAAMLRNNGVEVEIEGDDLIVYGKGRVPGGGVVATHMDHRIAMSALAMGLGSAQPVGVDDAAFIATSFTGFVELMRSLGADFS